MHHCYECPNVVMDVITCPKYLVDYRFHCQALFHSQTLCRDNMCRFGFLAVLVEIMYNILIYLGMALNKWNPNLHTMLYLLLSSPPNLMEATTQKINVPQLQAGMKKFFQHFPCEHDVRTWWPEFMSALG